MPLVIEGLPSTFGAILETPGTQSLTASQMDGSFTGTQDGIVVTPAAAISFVLTAPVQADDGNEFEVTLRVYDRYGHIATDYLGTVGFSSLDASAHLPREYTFTVDDAAVRGFTFRSRRTGRQTITALDQLMTDLSGSATLSIL